MSFGRVAFLSCDGGTGAFQPLQQACYARGGMKSHQYVHVGPNHPDFEDMRSLLTGDLPEEPGEEAGQADVDQGLPVASCPNDVAVDTVEHPSNVGSPGCSPAPGGDTLLQQTTPSRGFSRAIPRQPRLGLVPPDAPLPPAAA